MNKQRNTSLKTAVLFISLAMIACSNAVELPELSTQKPSSTQSNDLVTTEPTQPVFNPTATVKSPNLTIVPFDYSLQDAGDGWKNGKVFLAFENKTTQSIIPTDIFLGADITLETSEGPTYTVEMDSFPRNNKIELFRAGAIPPGFRFANIDNNIYSLSWKSASAATPRRIVFPDSPELSFDLPAQGTTIVFPFDSPPTVYDSFASLADKPLLDSATGIQAHFTGRCGNFFWYEPDHNRYALTHNTRYFRAIASKLVSGGSSGRITGPSLGAHYVPLSSRRISHQFCQPA